MSNIITSGTTFQNDLNAANIAVTAANTATVQANLATIAASNAAQSASRAFNFATNAAISANRANSSASLAAVYAKTARTANTITLTSVTNAPAGSNGWVQFRSGNGFSGSSNFTFLNNQLVVNGTINSVNENILGNLSASNVTAFSGNISNLRANSISVFGNVTGSFAGFSTLSVSGAILGNGQSLTGVAPLNNPVFTGVPIAPTPGYNTYGNQIATTAFVINQIANFTGITGSTFSVTGNITSAQNIVATVGMTATGNITGGNLRTTGLITATGSITTAGNLLVGGIIQTNSNVTFGNITSAGNVIGANLRTTGLMSATGNLTSGNVITGNVTAMGNVQATNANVANSLSVSGGIKQNQFTKLGTSVGQPGQIVWDTNYIYVCTSTNTWKRVALSSF